MKVITDRHHVIFRVHTWKDNRQRIPLVATDVFLFPNGLMVGDSKAVDGGRQYLQL